jgi:hypothetical protein
LIQELKKQHVKLTETISKLVWFVSWVCFRFVVVWCSVGGIH